MSEECGALDAIPLQVIEDLMEVAAYVSYGRGYVGVTPYPDAMARRALGGYAEFRDQDHSRHTPLCDKPHRSIEEEERCDEEWRASRSEQGR